MMDDLIFAQLYYKEIEDRLLREESLRQIEEINKRTNFVGLKKRFKRI